MGDQAAPQPGAPEASGPVGHDADESADTDATDEGPETTDAAKDVATDDLQQFSGASAHPSEPFTRPEPGESAAVESADARPAEPAHNPVKTEPDTQ